MSAVKYNFYNNENELRNRIDNLDKVANAYFLQIKELYMEDLFFMSVVDKSIKLIDAFLFALEKRNITVLATLTRVQMDCAMRAFATTMVSDSGEFCKEVLLNNTQVNKLIDTNNKKLTDKHLCEALGVYLNLPVYTLYKKVCGFVHFSSNSFYSITKAEEDSHFTMLVGRNNRKEDHNLIRCYFNDEVALYFAWLFHYSKFVIVPAFVSTIIYFFSSFFIAIFYTP